MNQKIQTMIQAVAVSLMLFALTACSPSGDNTPDKATTKPVEETKNDFPYAFEKVAKNTWVMHGPRELPNPQNKGFINNPGIVKTSAGLVMIDPGSSLQVGEDVLTEVKKISKDDIVAVFNTHIHGDHWLANQAIKAAYPDVKIYGHTEMLAEIEDGAGDYWLNLMASMTKGASKGTIFVAPDHAVENGRVIKIGNTHFKIHYYGIAHTKTDIMIEVLEDSVVFLGDNVVSLRIPRTSDGTFQGNISAIKKILETNAKIYVPGHGPTGDRTMVETYLNYLTLVYQAAKQTFEDDLDSSDVIAISRKTTTAYKNWPGYNELLGPQGAQAYSEVEEAEF